MTLNADMTIPPEDLPKFFEAIGTGKGEYINATWLVYPMEKEAMRIIANRSYFSDFDPFGDFDLIFGAAKLNLKFVEIPIRYRSRTYGETNISRFKHGWLLLKMTAFALNKIKFI